MHDFRPRRFDLIAFDWDGTLFDSTAIIVRSIQDAVRDVGGTVPTDEAAAWVIGMALPQALAHAAPDVPRERYTELGNRYRYHCTGRYHIAAAAVRAMGLERAIRTLENPQKRGKADRLSKMRKLEASLRTHGYDDACPINIMLCRTGGRIDSLRQGHHRVSACLACGVPKMCVEFSAAGALPQVFGRSPAIPPPALGNLAAPQAHVKRGGGEP